MLGKYVLFGQFISQMFVLKGIFLASRNASGGIGQSVETAMNLVCGPVICGTDYLHIALSGTDSHKNLSEFLLLSDGSL